MSASVDFMVRLRRIELYGMSTRDTLVLWTVKTNPGVMGRELALKIGLKFRSNVQHSIGRLLRFGFIEDHRVATNPLVPNRLYITPEGDAVLAEVVPI